MATYIGSQKAKWFLGNTKIKKVYRGDQKLYSSGNIVTYYVDSSTVYQEEVEEGASCLSPKTFTPTKSGWTFLGWRADKTASSSVLSSQVMGDAPVTLYAVFQSTVIVKYYNNSTTASTTSGYRYYNNGNVINPSFKLTQAAKSGWTARGWSIYNGANSSVTVANGATFTQASDVTLYGMYQKTITLSYNGNGATSGSIAAQTGTCYYNSSGNALGHKFTLSANAFKRTDYTFSKWALNGASGAQYAAGGTITLSANAVMYAVWTAIPATAFYLSSKNLTFNRTASNASASGYRPGDYWYLKKTHNGGVTYSTARDETASFDRQHCKKVTFTPYLMDGYFVVGSKQVDLSKIPAYAAYTVDISDQPETITCALYIPSGASDGSIQITNPYFS